MSSSTPTTQVSSRGNFIGAEEKHLNHVNEHDGDHEVRAPAVEPANEPAERDLVIEGLQAVPRFAGRGHVDERERRPVTTWSAKIVSAALRRHRPSSPFLVEPDAPSFRGSARQAGGLLSNQSATALIARITRMAACP